MKGLSLSLKISYARSPSAIHWVSMETPRLQKDEETPEAKRAARAFLKGACKRGETRAAGVPSDNMNLHCILYHMTIRYLAYRML